MKITAQELFEQIDNDYDRYPLPICFDEHDERVAFGLREKPLKEIADRFVKIANIRLIALNKE